MYTLLVYIQPVTHVHVIYSNIVYCFVDPAKIVSITQSQTLTEGDTLILYCNTSGIPLPEVTWSRVDGAAMPSSVGGGTHITVCTEWSSMSMPHTYILIFQLKS